MDREDFEVMELELTCLVAEAINDYLRPKVRAVAAAWGKFDGLCETLFSGRYVIRIKYHYHGVPDE